MEQELHQVVRDQQHQAQSVEAEETEWGRRQQSYETYYELHLLLLEENPVDISFILDVVEIR